MKRKHPPIVYVKWLDHWNSSGGWHPRSIADNKPLTAESVGWVIEEDSDGLTLAACLGNPDPSGVPANLGSIQYILKKCVIKRKVLG